MGNRIKLKINIISKKMIAVASFSYFLPFSSIILKFHTVVFTSYYLRHGLRQVHLLQY